MLSLGKNFLSAQTSKNLHTPSQVIHLLFVFQYKLITFAKKTT
jgi:hypothetical protein